MAAAGGKGMAPVGETAAPARAGIGQDIPSTGAAQAGGRTKRRVNTGFASGAASDGLLRLGAAGTLECADGVTGAHGVAGHTDVDSVQVASCGKTKEGSGWWKAEGRAVKPSRPRCPHNRDLRVCKECGGGSICEHKRIRSKCKECGGGSICEHNRRRSTCKDCGGGSICEHKRRRSKCKECGGAGICENKRIRCRCKECGGGSICEHERIRSECKECHDDKADFMPPDLEELCEGPSFAVPHAARTLVVP